MWNNSSYSDCLHQYRKGEHQMKLFKVGTILQVIYCSCCLIEVACMPLYTAFYTTKFGSICFTIGVIFILVSTFNPIGLIGTILNIIACFHIELKNNKKYLIWTIVSPFIIILSYILACCFFVYHSGGV